jgi:hypothetical protein
MQSVFKFTKVYLVTEQSSDSLVLLELSFASALVDIAIAVVGIVSVVHSILVVSGDLEFTLYEEGLPEMRSVVGICIPVVNFNVSSDVIVELDTFVCGFLCELGRHGC